VIPADPFEAEAKFCGGPAAVLVSSSYEFEGWSRGNAVDGIRTSTPGGAAGYSSDPNQLENHTEWIEVGVAGRRASKVVLYPSLNPGFPIDFKIQVWTGTSWVDRVVQTDYPLPGQGPQTFSWAPVDTTDRIRIYATRLRQVRGAYVLQFAEVEALP
jgi:hypothetical protein